MHIKWFPFLSSDFCIFMTFINEIIFRHSLNANESWKIIKNICFFSPSTRTKTKTDFNKQFGSVFRTFNNPTYFSRRLFRFADIYTGHLTNLLNYSTKHTFYPRRWVFLKVLWVNWVNLLIIFIILMNLVVLCINLRIMHKISIFYESIQLSYVSNR